jgi:hypothetical protein
MYCMIYDFPLAITNKYLIVGSLYREYPQVHRGGEPPVKAYFQATIFLSQFRGGKVQETKGYRFLDFIYVSLPEQYPGDMG